MPTSPDALRDPATAILAEQVRVIYVEGQRLILTGVAAALILVWVLWDHIAHDILLGWFGIFATYSTARLAMIRAYRRSARGSIDHRLWMTRAQWALAVGGSTWGLASFLLYVPDRIEYQLFLVTILLGAVVSGLITLAVYLPAYLVFIAPFLAATTIRFGIDNDPLHWGIALAPVVVLFIFVNFGRYIQNNFVESLKLRMELAERNRELAERTREAERANLAKSRFLAAASHDLRQPLHALNLFVAQLVSETDHDTRNRLIARIDAATADMNELFNALLDMSKLDAGVLMPNVSDFPVDRLFRRIEATFESVAREKGLRLRIVSSGARVRSDSILLERVLLNLVSNAMRYTVRGGVIVGCRRRGDRMSIEVSDTGIGIPDDEQDNVFAEFYQVATPKQHRPAGLGLGLAIVDRLCRLLEHPIELTSRAGKGSRFSILVPLASAAEMPAEPGVLTGPLAALAQGRLIVVIDDDVLVLQGMRGLLESWGYDVVTAESIGAVLTGLAGRDACPDLVISDYWLADRKSGVDAVAQLRRTFNAPIPAFLITGDTTTDRMREAGSSGLLLLHKPVSPMTLRATVNQFLRSNGNTGRRPRAAIPSAGP